MVLPFDMENHILDRWKNSDRESRGEEQLLQIPDLCRKRLLGYAEGFGELARSFAGDFTMHKEDRQSLLEERTLWENRQVIGYSLEEMAQIMVEVANEVFRFQPMEERKKRQLKAALRSEGIYVDELCYIPGASGDKAICMSMYTDKKGGRPAMEVADMLSVLLERQLQVSITSPYLVDRENRSFVFVEESRYIALTGLAKAVKENETISGDNYSILQSEKGKLTVLLSDGTGSGKQASMDSERVLDLMEKMLEAGYGIHTAVNMVNAALFARGEESNHPTLDICTLDLYKGSCDFIKVGGAASFLKRDGRVEQIAVGNLPLGIFQNVEITPQHRQLREGDYLIFMTDGVLDALGDNGYEDAMAEAIEELTEQNPGEIAERLLQLVIRLAGGRISDDMTILVVGLWENSGIT